MSSIEKLGSRCFYCGEKSQDYHATDHVIPVTRGGITVVGNLVHCCQSCNSAKGNISAFTYWLLRKNSGVSLHPKFRSEKSFRAALAAIQKPFAENHPEAWALAERMMAYEPEARAEFYKKVVEKQETDDPRMQLWVELFGEEYLSKASAVELKLLENIRDEQSALELVIGSDDARLEQLKELIFLPQVGKSKKQEYTSIAVRMLKDWDKLGEKKLAADFWEAKIATLAKSSRPVYVRTHKLVLKGYVTGKGGRTEDPRVKMVN